MSSIYSALPLLKQGIRRVVGSGEGIDVWRDPWIPLHSSVTGGAAPYGSPVRRVADLFQPNARAWDEGLVRSLFSRVEAEAILSIPLARVARPDGWSWKYTPKGNFTVSSAYQLAISPLVAKHSVTAFDSKAWVTLWSLNVPQKIRVFLWRACREVLPTTGALRRRQLYVPPECSGCSSQGESAIHVICACPRIRQIWDTGPVSLSQEQVDCNSFAELFQRLVDSWSQDQLCQFAYLAWMSWNARNARVFQKPEITNQEIVFKAARLVVEFQLAQHTDLVPAVRPGRGRQRCRWIPPPANTLKINVDAANHRNPDSVGVGAVVRDMTGKVMWARVNKIPGGACSILAEGLALRESLEEFGRIYQGRLLVEVDCLQLVQAMTGVGDGWSSEINGVIQDCSVLLSSFPDSGIGHIGRRGNKVAHGLAKYSLDCSGVVSWSHDFPSIVLSNARNDLALV